VLSRRHHAALDFLERVFAVPVPDSELALGLDTEQGLAARHSEGSTIS
jgi:hypothetical protein